MESNHGADSTTYYDSIAPGYDALHRDEQLVKLQAAYAALRTHTVPDEKTTVLDVGCGTGISSDFWAQFGCTVTGVDPAAQLIAQNKTKLCKFIVASAESLPFAEGSFDLVVSFTAVQNFSDIASGLHEMRRVAKSDAWFVITTLTRGPLFGPICEQINKTFSVKDTIVARNDTVFIARR